MQFSFNFHSSLVSRFGNSVSTSWVKVQSFKNPELLKIKFYNLQDAYKNGEFKVKIINCA